MKKQQEVENDDTFIVLVVRLGKLDKLDKCTVFKR